MRLIETYRFKNFSLWCETKDEKKWWLTSYYITNKGKEIYRHFECGYLPTDVLKMWSKITKLKEKGQDFIKDGIIYKVALIKRGDSHIRTFVPQEEHERISKEWGIKADWNWMFDEMSATGFCTLVDPNHIIDNRVK